MLNNKKMGFIPFWAAAAFLTVTTVIGYELSKDKMDFYESDYVGELIKNGKPIEDSKLNIKIKNKADADAYRNGEFEFTVTVDITDSMKVMNEMGYDSAGFFCDFSSRDDTAAANFALADDGRRIISLKAENEYNPFCRSAKVVFTSFDDAYMKLGDSTVVRLKRVPLHDKLMLDHQRERYEKWMSRV